MRPIGYKHTEETKKKISLSNTGKLSSQWKGKEAKYQANGRVKKQSIKQFIVG